MKRKPFRCRKISLPLPAVLTLLVLLGAALLTGTLTACTPDMAWNSDFILTTNLKVGTPYTGDTIEAGETVYYDFIAVANGTHRIEVTNLSAGIDLSWYLFSTPSYYNPDLILPTVDNNTGTNGDESNDTGALTANRKYYIAITENSGTSGTFEIVVLYQ